ncbi:hypothetical protein F5B20DRAFT_527940 [Whalleya microplaca]|nr:hypothetical protein F5B20DRAFT_527940 [Whalleya microplaca]
MAVQTSLPALLDSLTNSLTSALEATPKISGIEPTKDGVSLLDVKNELLLSYLQNLAFLILLKIRNAKDGTSSDHKGKQAEGEEEEEPEDLSDTVVRKLVELRLYLDKGVRPLEEKLKFQLDKILRAADDADRAQAQAARDAAAAPSDPDSASASESDSESSGSEAAGPRKPAPNLTAKQYGPRFSTFTHPTLPTGMASSTSTDKTGVYRPPKITPTAMPTTERRERRERRPQKSATMDEYVASEMSAVPVAEPSVGTTIVARGRALKTAGERAAEARRREYEEANFVRLPKESKRERAQRAKAEGHNSKKMNFGGEDWRDLGEGVDRIERLTKRSGGGGGGAKALLEKSRKRGRETTDSNRGSGLNAGTREMGERFNKRLKVMEGGRRDRGKR